MAKAGLLIYGATGYTGKLLSERAKALGMNFAVGGRDRQKTGAIARSLDVEAHVFEVDDERALRHAISEFACILHCAGPFFKTARQVMTACIDQRVHYLDITGEFTTYELAESLSSEAEKAGIMLLSGVGWDVVPSDCLALHTAKRVADPEWMRIGLHHFGGVSRGSALSGGEIVRTGPRARRDGIVVSPPDQQPALFDFGEGPELCVPLPMGDVITSWRSARVPNVDVYFRTVGSTGDAPVTDVPATIDLSALPDGPTPEERSAGRSQVIVEVSGRDGAFARSTIYTLSGYSFTQEMGIEVAQRVLAGEFKAGFQSPASAYGVALATSTGGGEIIDLD
jgi:short subunit dehydrogenase-like uncharacterized protein